MESNSEIKEMGFRSVSSEWKPAVIATLIYGIVVIVINVVGGAFNTQDTSMMAVYGGIDLLLSLFLVLPLQFAYTLSMLEFYRGDKDGATSNMFSYFSGGYSRALSLGCLKWVYELLWSLLFFIPGVVKHYSYAMSFYIAKDNQDLTAEQSIQASMKIMDGHKMDLFLLDLSFIGWILLSCLTMGVGFLFVTPYMENAHAAFYESLVDGGTISVVQ